MKRPAVVKIGGVRWSGSGDARRSSSARGGGGEEEDDEDEDGEDESMEC